MATIDYDGKQVVLVPGKLILESGMNVFGLHLFMESYDKVPEGIPTAFAFEHRGVRVVVDRAPDCDQADESHGMQELAKTIETAVDHGHEYTLREEAAKWAAHCINELDGSLLRKGLEVSASLAEFMNEFERNPND